MGNILTLKMALKFAVNLSSVNRDLSYHFSNPDNFSNIARFSDCFCSYLYSDGETEEDEGVPGNAMAMKTGDMDEIMQASPSESMALEIPRSKHWEKVSHDHVHLNPNCCFCGNVAVDPQVHHCYPFHFVVLLGRPDLELDPRNLRTMCGNGCCHLTVGHLGSYFSYNPFLGTMCQMHEKLRSNSLKQEEWDKYYFDAKANRPKPISLMNLNEKVLLRRAIDAQLKPSRAILNKYDLQISPIPSVMSAVEMID